jgi:hypothetical protein
MAKVYEPLGINCNHYIVTSGKSSLKCIVHVVRHVSACVVDLEFPPPQSKSTTASMAKELSRLWIPSEMIYCGMWWELRTGRSISYFFKDTEFYSVKANAKISSRWRYIYDRAFWQCTIKARRQKMKMRAGNWFENGRHLFATATRFYMRVGWRANFYRAMPDIMAVYFKITLATR